MGTSGCFPRLRAYAPAADRSSLDRLPGASAIRAKPMTTSTADPTRKPVQSSQFWIAWRRFSSRRRCAWRPQYHEHCNGQSSDRVRAKIHILGASALSTTFFDECLYRRTFRLRNLRQLHQDLRGRVAADGARRCYVYPGAAGRLGLSGKDKVPEFVQLCKGTGVPESWFAGAEPIGRLAEFQGADSRSNRQPRTELL